MRKRQLSQNSTTEIQQNLKMCKNSDEVEILDTPVKSESDKKDYRLFRINKNKLTVLAISHAKLLPHTHEHEHEDEEMEHSNNEETGSEDDEDDDECSGEKLAAASLCIDAGSFHDPESGVPGMAHFVEHMIFMGSEKYPDENAYDKYITTHGGSNNAMTECEYTNFYFEITEKGFEGALDRFSNLFIAPLMLKDSMNREREAVESEFQNRINDDHTRLEQLLCSSGTPGHPSNIFAWGNLKTLKDNISDDDLYARAHEFRKKHYVANKMYLCLESRLELDELQEMAVKYFADVPFKTDIDPPLSTNPQFVFMNAFKSDFYEKMYYVKPKSDRIALNLTWCLPASLDQYRCKPHNYVSHLVGHEGAGSFCSYLRKNLLAIGVSAGNSDMSYESNSLFTLFMISITLTDYGLENIDKVLEAVFSYLLLLQKSGPNEEIFNEIKQIEDNSFRFKEEKSSDDNVEEAATAMKYYPPKDVLTGSELYFEYNKDQIAAVIEALNQPKFNLTILTDKHQFDKTEEWFGTEYAEVDLPASIKNLWATRKLSDEFFLPEKNPYICSDFKIFYDPESSEKIPPYPVKIFENECCETWYRLDDKFLLPNAYVYAYFMSPECVKSTYNHVMMSLFSLLIKHYLAETIYSATIASLDVKFNSTARGIMLQANGYNEKLHVLIDTVVKNMVKFCDLLEESAFETYKKQLKKNCYNNFIESHKLNKDLRIGIIETHVGSTLEIYNEVDNVKIDDLREFANAWMQQLKIQILIQGNMQKPHCLEITDNILKTLQCKEIENKALIEKRSRQIPVGNNYVKVKSLLPGNKNSTITNQYQIGECSITLQCLLDLFVLIQDEPLFDTLRTQEQLGYAVHGMVRDNCNVLGFSVTIMSQEDKNPMHIVDEKIEDFVMEKMAKIIEEMNEKEFETTKQSLIKLKMVVDTDLKTEMNRNWGEITAQDYLFDRREKEVEILMNIQRSDIVEFYQQQVKNSNIRKLSVQVIGCLEEIPAADANETNYKPQLEMITEKLNDSQNIVTDIEEFRNSLYLYPVLKTKLT